MPRTAYLYFTHGTLLQEFSSQNEENHKKEWAKYCAISGLEVGMSKMGEQVQKELILDLHNDNQYCPKVQGSDKQADIYSQQR